MRSRIILLVSSILLIFVLGCKKDDDAIAAKGIISFKGENYNLINAGRDIHEIDCESGFSLENVYYSNNFHVLNFTGKNAGTRANITIHSMNDLISGEYYVQSVSVKHEYNSIQMNIDLADDFVFFAHHINPAKKIHLSFSEKGDNGIYEILLKYVDICI